MYLGLLGGTFNPVHIGHIRLALEVLALRLPALIGMPQRVRSVELIPCATPAHKPQAGILPFALRVQLTEAAIAGIEGLRVNALEGERQGASYTWDTLCQYKRVAPAQRLLFILGDEAFTALKSWYRGLEIPTQADMLIVPRAARDAISFTEAVHAFWPDALQHQYEVNYRADIPGGGHVYWTPLPHLDISASQLRAQWCAGGNIRYLVPDSTLQLLTTHQHCVRSCWSLAQEKHASAHS